MCVHISTDKVNQWPINAGQVLKAIGHQGNLNQRRSMIPVVCYNQKEILSVGEMHILKLCNMVLLLWKMVCF